MISWVKIKTFTSLAEAEVAKAYLEAQGIHCQIQSDNVGGTAPQMGLSTGIHLLVAASEQSEAQRFLGKI